VNEGTVVLMQEAVEAFSTDISMQNRAVASVDSA
jgi:hypothetical protein